jgi:hypothetical protein
MLKKKIWASFHRIIELFTQKFVTKLSKIWVWDPRSGIRKKPISDPGPQHWFIIIFCAEGHKEDEATAGEEQGDGGQQEDQEGREAPQHLHEGGEKALPRRSVISSKFLQLFLGQIS